MKHKIYNSSVTQLYLTTCTLRRVEDLLVRKVKRQIALVSAFGLGFENEMLMLEVRLEGWGWRVEHQRLLSFFLCGELVVFWPLTLIAVECQLHF